MVVGGKEVGTKDFLLFKEEETGEGNMYTFFLCLFSFVSVRWKSKSTTLSYNWFHINLPEEKQLCQSV